MGNDALDDIKNAVADHLEVEPEDLLLVRSVDSSFTFRQPSTGQTHEAIVEVGPEGPVVTVD